MPNLALAFLNAPPDRLLGSPPALVEWLVAVAGVPPEAAAPIRRSPPDARACLSEARALRWAVEDALSAMGEGRPLPPGAAHALNRILGSAAAVAHLVEADGDYRLEERRRMEGPAGLLAPVAAAAAELLVEADPARLRRCAAPECRLWFLDTSRNGRRKWCSMERCGNRAKAARHYRRTRGAAGAA